MIKATDIKKSYGSLLVLKGINFEAKEAEVVSIVGASGAGKSSLLQILGTLSKPDSGRVMIDGTDLFSLGTNALADFRNRKIGFVFQSFNLLPRSTVLRNVMMPLIYNKVPKILRGSLATEALKAVGLEEERWSHLSNQLSGGQMQRVAIARALVNNPEIILADEPTGNLDSKTGEIVLETFRKLNEDSGHTVILITHDNGVASHADRVIEIKDGAIISDKKNK